MVGSTARPQTAATDFQDTMPEEVTSLPVPPEPEPSLSPEVSTNAKREKYQRKPPRLSETAELEKVKFPQKPRFPRNPRREPNQPRMNVALLGCLRTRQGVWESVQWYKFLIVCGISDPRECFTCIIHVVMR